MSRSGAAEIDISVVIPAYHGEHTIASCLESIKRATQGRRREIIVVDSSASNATAEVVLQRFPEVILIRSQRRLSAGGARNRGIEAASGRLIFFVDQDCIVPPHWIDRLEARLQAPHVGAAGGSVGIQDLSNLSGCAVYFLEFLNHFPGRGQARFNSRFLIGCNCCCRADVLRLVRFPDQTLGEDIIFSNKIHNTGFQTVYDPATTVLHKNREGWKAFFAYNYKMGRAAAAYHRLLQLWWAKPVLRLPILAFSAPALVLPSIGISLLRAPWPYLLRFLLLSPMCLVGNLVWAAGFRREVNETKTAVYDRPYSVDSGKNGRS
jgi:GT2 family glycosyltransferase